MKFGKYGGKISALKFFYHSSYICSYPCMFTNTRTFTCTLSYICLQRATYFSWSKTQILSNAVTAYQATLPFFLLFCRRILAEKVEVEVPGYFECQMRQER
jgi:hypothetical protein